MTRHAKGRIPKTAVAALASLALLTSSCIPAFSASAGSDTKENEIKYIRTIVQFQDDTGQISGYRSFAAAMGGDKNRNAEVAQACGIDLASVRRLDVCENYAAGQNEQELMTKDCKVDEEAGTVTLPENDDIDLDSAAIVITQSCASTDYKRLFASQFDTSSKATAKALGLGEATTFSSTNSLEGELVAGRRYDVHSAWISGIGDNSINIHKVYGLGNTQHNKGYGFAVTFGYSVKYESDGYNVASTGKKDHILWTGGSNYSKAVDDFFKTNIPRVAVTTAGGTWHDPDGSSFRVPAGRPILWGDCCSPTVDNGFGEPVLDVSDTDGNGRSYIEYLGIVKGSDYDSSWSYRDTTSDDYGKNSGGYTNNIDHDWSEFAPTKGKMAFFFHLEAKSCATGENYQDIGGFFFVDTTGNISLEKESANTALIKANSAYSLAGAEYTVYSDEKCTEKVATMTTDKDGKAELAGVNAGNYWVVETKASPGYALDTKVRKISVEADQTSKLNSSEQPNYGPGAKFTLTKTDARSTKAEPEGDASLSKARFEVAHYASAKDKAEGRKLHTWTLESDEKGQVVFDKAHQVGGDALCTDSSGAAALPLGSYTVTETAAPKGYLVNKDMQSFDVNDTSNTDGSPALSAFKMNANWVETPQAGGIVIGKGDSSGFSHEDKNAYNYAQGDASLEGAKFTIYNESAHNVVIDVNGDGSFSADESFAPGSAVWTSATAYDEKLDAFVVKTPERFLPYGSYKVVETKEPRGFLNEGVTEKVFKIESDGQYVQLVKENGILNTIILGGVQIEKHDLELDAGEALGGSGHGGLGDEGYRGSSLKGIEFELVNRSEHGVMVAGSFFAPGEVIATLMSNWNDNCKSYTAQTEKEVLPYGSYGLREVKTNDSYLQSDSSEHSFKILENGTTVTEDVNGNRLIWKNQVVRGDLKLSKKAADTGAKLAGIPFLITNETTGEAHVAVTDSNGALSTESAFAARGDRANANDRLLELDSISSADVDMRAGVWFGLGENGSEAKAADDLGALPYGHYQISELRCEANKGWKLWNDSFDVFRDTQTTGCTIDIGTIDDQPNERISTTARDKADGDKLLAPDELVTIVDAVSCEWLVPGREYTLKGTLMLKEGNCVFNDENGIPITATKTFTAEQATQTIELEFDFDAQLLAGESIVVFEKLFDGENEIAVHEDIDDSGQTVLVSPRIATQAYDKSDKDKYLTGKDAVVVDEVEYDGLKTGQTYVLNAMLMDQQTGRPAKDSAGNDITGSKTFSPKKKGGTEKVELHLDAGQLAGKDLVVFEKCSTESGETIASHEDIDSEDQLVRTAWLQTSATDASDGDQEFDPAAKKLTINDSVTFSNLEPGVKYTVSGVLVDKETGKKLKVDGKPVTGTKTFTTETLDGTVDVTFAFDASKVKSTQIVVFEQVKRKDKVVAAHEDIDAESQTVTAAGAAGSASAGGDGTQTGATDTSDSPYVLAGLVALVSAASCAAACLVKRRRHVDEEDLFNNRLKGLS